MSNMLELVLNCVEICWSCDVKIRINIGLVLKCYKKLPCT